MKHVYTSLCAAAALLVGGQFADAQRSSTLTEASYLHARQVLDRGIDALGGLNAFRLVDDIHFVSSGSITEIGQSAGPDTPYYLRPLDTEGVFDFLHRRYYLLLKTNYLGSGPRGSSVVTTERGGFTVDLRSNAVYPLGASAVAGTNASVQRSFPHLLLQLVLRRVSSLRWVGEAQYEGHQQNVVDFAENDGNGYTLFFDAQSGVLTKMESLTDGLLEGLTSRETIFTDYRSVNGVRVPFRVVTKVGPNVTSDLSYTEVVFNQRTDSSLFAQPPNAALGPEVGGPRRPISLTPLGRDAYYVDAMETGGIFFYSAMFVVLNDYVLVVEAPLNDNVSRLIIAKIKETAPGKPIRYLIPTHYHTDHTGGVRGYIAEGTTIVTTPGNRAFFEKLAEIGHPLNADNLALQSRPPLIEAVDGKRTFSDGDHVVELYSVGRTSHADEMLMAYLPKEKLLFVSDLFLVSFKGQNGPAESSTLALFDKLRELNLDVRTIAGGHGRIGTMDELKAAVAQARH
jgi:glyoxylase-like metal-dependent hydrolase (beta-lactamase superfamily II)